MVVKKFVCYGLLFVFLIVSVIGALNTFAVLLIISAIILFAFACYNPLCKKRETFWIIILVLFIGLPANIILAIVFSKFDFIIYNVLYNFMWLYTIKFLFIVAIEMLTLGIISKLIWRNQEKLSFTTDD